MGQPSSECLYSSVVVFIDSLLNRFFTSVGLVDKLIVQVIPDINQILAILMSEFCHSSTFKVKVFLFSRFLNPRWNCQTQQCLNLTCSTHDLIKGDVVAVRVWCNVL